MRAKKKRFIVIVSLCVLLLIMSAGYAAFSSVLNIKGISSITSNWDIKITNVKTKNTNGSAENTKDPIWNNLTATVEADLYEPGDYVEYEITIENKGNLNAKLSKISMSDVNDSPIKFTTSGVTEGDNLNTNSVATLTVKVEYDSNAGKVTEETISEITITLEYVQDNGGAVPPLPSEESAADELIKTVVTSGDGLYADEYEEGRYVYKGANPNNYITFNNETWRIISVETDGTLKIMRKDSIGSMAWDTSESNNWTRPATLNTYLNNDYYNTLSNEAQALIQTHSWGIGPVTESNTDLAGQIASENGTTWNGNIGLITASDAIKANSNTEQCGNLKLNENNRDTCKTTNYLVQTSDYVWTISPYVSSTIHVFVVAFNGNVGGLSTNTGCFTTGNTSYSCSTILPALYLKSNITLSGEGTETNPYTIN